MKTKNFLLFLPFLLIACQSNSSTNGENTSAKTEETQVSTEESGATESYNSDSSTTMVKTLTETVRIKNVAADVQVKIHPGNDVKIVVTGPDSLRKQIKSTVINGDLTIWQFDTKRQSSRGSSLVITQNGSSVVINGKGSGNRVTINGKTYTADEERGNLQIDVYIPIGTNLNLEDIDGSTAIGNTEGQLTISSQNAGDVSVGIISGATISQSGSGDISIEKLTGNCFVNCAGSGDIDIKGGRVATIALTSAGSGDFTFNGVADMVAINAAGSGDIHVSKSLKEPSINAVGSGDVHVGR